LWWFSIRTQPVPGLATVQAILAGAQAVLGYNFFGMVLHGSLTGGDFDPHNTDIDFVAVTDTELSSELISWLTAMRARRAAARSKWATHAEGSDIPQRALRRYDQARTQHPHTIRGTCKGESQLALMQLGSDWIVRRDILCQPGAVVAGPAPSTFIDPVQPDDLRRAALAIASEWFPPSLRDPHPLRQAGHHAFVVVTLCRILYTLEHGTVVSKPAAAHWAQAAHGGRWAALIERALAWEMRLDCVYETLDFVRYTLERGDQFRGAENSALRNVAWLSPASAVRQPAAPCESS
jgi:hypothetical protein